MRGVERLDDRRLDRLEAVLEVERRERGLEQRREHVAVEREPLDLALGEAARLAGRGRSPSRSSRATTAQLARETTCERSFAIRPSLKSGNRSKSARAIASSSTESPRNSSRSYEAVRSAAHDECVKTAAARSAGSASISSRERVQAALTGGT